MLDIKKLLTKVLNCCYTQGTSGNWTYRKYADGTAECWGTHTPSIACSTNYMGGYWGYKDVAFPIGLFNAKPSITVSGMTKNYGMHTVDIYNSSSTSARIYAWNRTTSSGLTYPVSIYAVGKWK